MSKTKGNVLDPLEVTTQYGTDAVRFALVASAAPGTDIAFSQDKIESYRAFANKIWNAGRFILMNLDRQPASARKALAMALEPVPKLGYAAVNGNHGANHTQMTLAHRWIFSRLAAVTAELNDSLANYRFHEAAHSIYHFFWHEFCDWYLEWVKPEIAAATTGEKPSSAWINLMLVFKSALHLLHPFMPFITEELWHRLPGVDSSRSIALSKFALVGERANDPVSEREFDEISALIVAARNAKAERGLQRERPSAQVAANDPRTLASFRECQDAIARLAGLEALNFTQGRLPSGADRIAVNATTDLRLFHEVKIDPAAERARLEKEKSKIESSLAQTRRQIENQEFVSRAPREVVRGVEKRRDELAAQYEKLLESLERLMSTEGSAANLE